SLFSIRLTATLCVKIAGRYLRKVRCSARVGFERMNMRRKILLGLAGLLLIATLGLGTLFYLLTARVPGEYFDSAGVQLHYKVEGTEAGEPLILIHGLAANADINWRRPGIISMLGKDFQIISYDCRGH